MIIDSKEKPTEPPNYDTIVPRPRIPAPPPPTPQTYTFSQWAQNSVFLFPPGHSPSSHFLLPGEEQVQPQPLYRITVELDLNPFLPTSYVTKLFKCGHGMGRAGADVRDASESELIGEFALALNKSRAVIRMGDTATRLSNALYSVNSHPRHFNWILKTKLHWDCREIMKDGSPRCICYIPSDSVTLPTPSPNYNPSIDMYSSHPTSIPPSPSPPTLHPPPRHNHPHNHPHNHNRRQHHPRGLHTSRSSPYLSSQAQAQAQLPPQGLNGYGGGGSNAYLSNQSTYSSNSSTYSFSSRSSHTHASSQSNSSGATATTDGPPSPPYYQSQNAFSQSQSQPPSQPHSHPQRHVAPGEKQYEGITIAIFIPPPPDRSPPIPDATLTVFPYGHQLMDEVVMSALVVERMLLR